MPEATEAKKTYLSQSWEQETLGGPEAQQGEPILLWLALETGNSKFSKDENSIFG